MTARHTADDESADLRRNLPTLTPANQAFWQSGREGDLTLDRCDECGEFLHPSLEICPSCPSSSSTRQILSGNGVVVGYTVSHRRWNAHLPLPYVVAVVALDEAPTVRLTTNLVGCDPDDVQIGMAVRVRFQAHEDVWLPLFEPTGEARREPPPEVPVRPTFHVRPARKFEEQAVISGVGMSEVGRRLERSPIALAVEASRAAIGDAGLDSTDVDGLVTYPGGPPGSGRSEGGIPALEEALRLHPTWFHGGRETSGQVGSIVAAMLAVAAGLCRHVLCVRTVWEATFRAAARNRDDRPSGWGRVDGPDQWRAPFGAVAAHSIAVCASRYFHHYGADREALGWIAVNARRNAELNPNAIYREPMSLDDYFAAEMITTPFGLYDCDVPVDGSVAFIVSAPDAVGDLSRSVMVDAVGTRIAERISWDQGTLLHQPGIAGPACHLWERSSLRPRDVDVAELYDGFTFSCLSWLEALGFCGPGEAPAFVERGERIGLGGDLPLNTHGGQLSAGRTHGYGMVHEAVVQLRGEADARQVAGAEVALVSTGGGTPGGCMIFTAGR